MPASFALFNAAKHEAEANGHTMFTWNDKRYTQHTWSNGIHTWRKV